MPISGMIGPSGILKLRGAFGIFLRRINTPMCARPLTPEFCVLTTASAHDNHIISFDFHCSHLFFRLNTVLRLYMHACGKRGNAGTNIGLPVYNHDTVGTSADGTKYAARFVFFAV